MGDWEIPSYPLESHQIETEDNYILTLTRVRSSKSEQWANFGSSETQRKPAVLFVHGFMCSGNNWIMNSPDKVLRKIHLIDS